jgi:predicted nucleotidyltransferase
MRDEYDFSKGKRGGFYHPDAKVHLPGQRDLVYGADNSLGAAMSDYSLTPDNEQYLCEFLRDAIPNLLGIYAFGSRVQGNANAESDLDLAVLVTGYAEPIQLWELASHLADKFGYEVDLLDLRAASTVMQYQVITTGKCLWAKDVQAGVFECYVLSEKTALDSARAQLLHEIKEDGAVYGR